MASCSNSLYIASSLRNKERVLAIRDKFLAVGVGLTYDWAGLHGEVHDTAALVNIALAELEGVKAAKCVLVVTPGRLGTYFEFGVAYALEKPIVLLFEEPPPFPVSFHNLPNVRTHTEFERAFNDVLDLVR